MVHKTKKTKHATNINNNKNEVHIHLSSKKRKAKRKGKPNTRPYQPHFSANIPQPPPPQFYVNRPQQFDPITQVQKEMNPVQVPVSTPIRNPVSTPKRDPIQTPVSVPVVSFNNATVETSPYVKFEDIYDYNSVFTRPKMSVLPKLNSPPILNNVMRSNFFDKVEKSESQYPTNTKVEDFVFDNPLQNAKSGVADFVREPITTRFTNGISKKYPANPDMEYTSLVKTARKKIDELTLTEEELASRNKKKEYNKNRYKASKIPKMKRYNV